MGHTFSTAAVAALLLSCQTITPTQNAEIDRNVAMQVTCSAGRDCEMKWARALTWVQANSRWKLRIVNDMIISTEGPLDSPSPAFEITKVPQSSESYEIRFRAGCGNIFGCVPSVRELNADFNTTVMGTSAFKSDDILSLYGLKLGMSKNDVRAKLGEPQQRYEGWFGDLHGERWVFKETGIQLDFALSDGTLRAVSRSH